MFNPKQTRKIAAVIILVVIVAMVATSIIPYIILRDSVHIMAVCEQGR